MAFALGNYSKLFVALSGVATIFIHTQWPDGTYTAAVLAAIAAALTFVVPNAASSALVTVSPDAPVAQPEPAVPTADNPPEAQPVRHRRSRTAADTAAASAVGPTGNVPLAP